jgi:hypothetical protein
MIILEVDIFRVKDVTYVTFEVLTVVLMKAHFFWYVVSCHHFGGACCPHIQGLAVEVAPEDGGSTLL